MNEQLEQLDKDRRRGEQATQLVNHPLFQEAKRLFFEQLAAQRRSSPLRDSELHSILVHAEQVADYTFQYLESLIRQGESAKEILTNRETFAGRVRYALENGIRNPFNL